MKIYITRHDAEHKTLPNDTVSRIHFNAHLAEQIVEYKHRNNKVRVPSGFPEWLTYIKQITHQSIQS